MPDAVKLSEASPEELKKIQHATLRALAQSLGADESREDDLIHFNREDEVIVIIIKISGPEPGGGGDRLPD
jgi:hypothetical protein